MTAHSGEGPDATTCPHCGTQLATATIDFQQTPDVTESVDQERAELQPGEMAQVAYCPNPDCPAGASGEAGAEV